MYFMTIGRCAQCGGPLPPPARTGRRRVYCSPRCRSLASYHRARARLLADPMPTEELLDYLAALPDPFARLV
jgi:hypothetical protein